MFVRFAAFVLLWLAMPAALSAAESAELSPGVRGDGVHDDTAGLQKLLDGEQYEVLFPSPPVCLLISKPLKIHSGQTLLVDRRTVVRLKAGSDQVMLTNADPDAGNENITLVGGVWDMDNEHQSQTEYQKTRRASDKPYAADAYLGVAIRFHGVKNLTIRGLTIRNPVTFGLQLGNLRQFTIEDITFDYNLKRTNMDGVHIHGPARWGRITNLKGATNDDLVALNADDGRCFEMSRGPIEDVSVDGIYSDNGYTAVRLLSAGSPVRRIQISNVFGTYRYNVVSLTNHAVHPGTASTFEDIALRGLFCAKSTDSPKPASGRAPTNAAPIWVAAPARVTALSISDFHRTESARAADTIAIDPGATVDSLQLSNVTLTNRTTDSIYVIYNGGIIGALAMNNVFLKAEGGPRRGAAVCNAGSIEQHDLKQVFAVNAAAAIVAPERSVDKPSTGEAAGKPSKDETVTKR